MAFDTDLIQRIYEGLPDKIAAARRMYGRPLTLSEKILTAHAWGELPKSPYRRGEDYVAFGPDRVAMQDATAQMALLQFMQAGKDRTAVPSTSMNFCLPFPANMASASGSRARALFTRWCWRIMPFPAA